MKFKNDLSQLVLFSVACAQFTYTIKSERGSGCKISTCHGIVLLKEGALLSRLSLVSRVSWPS